MSQFGPGPPGGGFGPSPGGGVGPPPGGGFGPPPQAGASALAITSLILGIASWLVGGPVLSIPGAILGKVELGKIERGESPAAGQQMAQFGYWISLVNTIFFVAIMCLVCLIYIVFFLIAMGGVAANSAAY